MKRLISFLACTFCISTLLFSQKIVETDYYLNNPKLGGDAIIKSLTKEVKDGKSYLSFEVQTSDAGSYFADFWICPTKLQNGEFASYQIEVNGNDANATISPTVGDWQSLNINNDKKITLRKGINVISIISEISDIPLVEHVKLSKNKGKSRISNNSYSTYKNNIKLNKQKDAIAWSPESTTDTLSSLRSARMIYDEPMYNYTYCENINIAYTFYKTVYFTQGQQIFVATNGVDKMAHILEMFSANAPETYSWRASSNNNCMASLNINIPSTGYYYVKLRSYLNARSGLCNININGENYYENVPIFSGGVRCYQGTDKVYNTFTCHNTGDPRLWIEEGASIPGIISAYNDDYRSSGNFSWGLNSRIKKQYVRPVHAALLSTYSSYSPTGKCDLYIKCMNSDIMSYFENLAADDAIQSAPETRNYNCISWSGGITSYWEWPLSPYSDFYSTDDLTAFDRFYSSRGFTRNGATEGNSVVDLWAIVSSNGERKYTHASIKKSADNNAHGYDWESKPGSMMRTFHPRYSLVGSNYGQVVEYYIRNSQQSRTVEEEIADGTSEIEYVEFTTEENNYINQQISKISSSLLSQFDAMYLTYLNIANNSIYSNPKQISNCEEYNNLLTFCRSNSKLKYCLFKKLGEGDIPAILLIEDLTLINNTPALAKVKNYNINNQYSNNVFIIRPVLSNTMSYVKELLGISSPISSKLKLADNTTTGISYSNLQEFSVNHSIGTIQVEFSLPDNSIISLDVIDLNGNTINSVAKNANLESGFKSYIIDSKKIRGTYLVRLIVNGKLNVKKIQL